MATDKPAATAAQPTGAIAALCDHAGEVWSFFAQVLGQRPLVRDERARHDLQAQLRGLPRGSCSWRSETALGFCVRAAAKASEDFEKAGAPFDAADCATALWNGFQEERNAILERVESLYPPAVHECHVHGDLTRTAHDAVRQLVEMLRGLWGAVEWDDWSERSSGVSNAIHEARVWAVPPAETVKASAVSSPVRGDDEWQIIERGLPLVGRDVLVFLHGQRAYSSDSVQNRNEIASALEIDSVDVKKAIKALREHGQKHGRPLVESTPGGPFGGSWITPDGIAVVERIPDRAGQHSLPTVHPLSLKPDRTG